MLITTKNGKAIARAIALALCVVMLVAFATSCSDDTAVRAEEAYNAALKAEEAAKNANQAASNAQTSADNAMDKAEGAETLAGTKLTEKEVSAAITAALAAYAKAADVDVNTKAIADLKTALTKLLTEETIKSWISAGDKATEEKVLAAVEELLEDYAKTADVDGAIADVNEAIEALKEDIKDIADDVLANYNELSDKIAESEEVKALALTALTEALETRNELVLAIAKDKFYTNEASDLVRAAYDVAMIEILCATTEDDIDAAVGKFTSAVSYDNLPTIEDVYYDYIVELEADDLVISISSSNFNLTDGDEGLVSLLCNEMRILLTDRDFVAAHPNAFVRYESAEGETNLWERAQALIAEINALGEVWSSAQTEQTGPNSLINGLAFWMDAEYAKYANKNQIGADISSANTAINDWIDYNFGANSQVAQQYGWDTTNANIDRMLYNRYEVLEDKTDDGELNTVTDLYNKLCALEKYDDDIAALVGAIIEENAPDGYVAPLTKWNADSTYGYILINNVVKDDKTEKDLIDALKAAYDADQATYEFENEITGMEAAYAILVEAYNYAAYAQTIEDAFVAENSTVAAALNALAALDGKLAYADIIADDEDNKFKAATEAYNVWAADKIDDTTDPVTVVIDIKNKTIADILGAELTAALKSVNARRDQLTRAKAAADILNAGGVVGYQPVAEDATFSTLVTYYTYDNVNGYVEAQITEFAQGVTYYTQITTDGIDSFFTGEGEERVADVVYYDIIELEKLAALRDAWAEAYEIETTDTANYDLVKNADLQAATDAANALIDAILEDEATKAFEKAIDAFYKVTNNGTDFSKLYGYVLIDAAIEACNNWYLEAGVTVTVGIKKFEEHTPNLSVALGDLLYIKNNKYLGTTGVVTKAETDYNAFKADLNAFLGAEFDLEEYDPTVYDAELVRAAAGAKKWVETYLDAEGNFAFTDTNGAAQTIDRINLLTEADYDNIVAAFAKYDEFITTKPLAELNAIESAIGKYEIENGWKVNIITDKAVIEDIDVDIEVWIAAYLTELSDDDLDARLVKYNEIVDAYEELISVCDTIYDDALAAYGDAATADTLAAKIAAITADTYTANLYSKVKADDALYIARTAYDAFVTNYLKIEDNTSAAYATVNDESDEFFKTLKAAITAIEAAEAEVDALAAAKNTAGETFANNVTTLIGDGVITPADAANIAALLEEYEAWAEGIDFTYEETTVLYNVEKVTDALEKLEAADDKLAAIDAALDLIADKIAALGTRPDTTVGTGTYEEDCEEYSDAVEELLAAVDAYIDLNADACDAEGTLLPVASTDAFDASLTADQIDEIYTAEAIEASLEAITIAQTLYQEYETEATNAGMTDKIASLQSVKTSMIAKIVKDAEDSYKPADTAKVESFVRAQMNAVMSATGVIVPPVYDDFDQDYDNWQETTTP